MTVEEDMKIGHLIITVLVLVLIVNHAASRGGGRGGGGGGRGGGRGGRGGLGRLLTGRRTNWRGGYKKSGKELICVIYCLILVINLILLNR